jgi:uncharacterized repeat protein (TIGR01451 family)
MPGPDEHDLVTVALHELIHGCGFSPSMQIDDGLDAAECRGLPNEGCWSTTNTPFPDIFDGSLVSSDGLVLTEDISSPSLAMGEALLGQVVFDQPSVRMATNNQVAALYTPSVWSKGVGISHLDPAAYPTTGSDWLMRPDSPEGKACHHPGEVSLAILEALGWPRVNDHFRNRYRIEGRSGTDITSNRFATREEGEPIHDGGNPGGPTVWWEWVAAASGQLTLSTDGSTLDTILAVYTGSRVDDLSFVAGDNLEAGTETIDFPVVGGTSYQVAVDGAYGEVGNIQLTGNLVAGDADISIDLTDSPDPVLQGEQFVLAAEISNLGPLSATDVTFDLGLAPFYEFVSSSGSAACTVGTNAVHCVIASLPVGSRETIEITVVAPQAGVFEATGIVDAEENDPDLENNGDPEVTTVLAAADLAMSLTELSDPVPVGTNITWLVNVTNNGPSQATNVVLVDTLPASVVFVATNMPGICSETGGVVTCQIGSLGVGFSFPVIEIVGTPMAGGTLVNVASVNGTETDSQPLNDTGEEITVAVDPGGFVEQKLVASDGMADARLGWSVAIDGDTAVVGAYFDNGEGSAYVFVRNGTIWIEQQKLTSSDGSYGKFFGYSVAISGDSVVVGAPEDDAAGSRSGSVYVFVRRGTIWTEQQKLTASDPIASGVFGVSVAISEDTLIVGAAGDSDPYTLSGSSYVFVRSNGVWMLQEKLTTGGASDGFGYPVSIDGDTLVVGSPRDDEGGSSAGAAYVYANYGSSWIEQQKLRANDSAAQKNFGSSVSIDGDTIVLGSPASGGIADAAYIFVRSGATWVEQEKFVHGFDEGFGRSVAVNGSSVVVGSYFYDLTSPYAKFHAGSAYVFIRDGYTWTERTRVNASDAASNDLFGNSVGISDGVALVGSPGDDDRGSLSGSAYAFDLSSLFSATVALIAPSTSLNLDLGEALTLEWMSTNTDPGDSMVLAMKRDIVPASVTEPDGVNWFRFTTGTPNDGSEVVTIPEGIAFASDWRFYVRHVASGAFDGSDFTFAIEGQALCAPTLDLAMETISSTEVFEACTEISAGDSFEIVSPGDVTLRAGQRVILRDGFSVGSGARLQVIIDPALEPPQ